jgi:hypothetical protein
MNNKNVMRKPQKISKLYIKHIWIIKKNSYYIFSYGSFIIGSFPHSKQLNNICLTLLILFSLLYEAFDGVTGRVVRKSLVTACQRKGFREP